MIYRTHPAILGALALSGCLGPWPSDDTDTDNNVATEEAVLGFVYSSSQNDGGWAQTHHAAATEAADFHGIPLAFRPAVASPDARAAIDELIEDEGATIVYTTSSGYIAATQQASIDYPDVTFFSCCGKASNDNLKSYFGRMYQPLFLAGYLAGKQTCTGQLGVVAAFPNPQFVRHINAFTLGAQVAAGEDNREVNVDVRFIYNFFNVEDETNATVELMDAGADVILAQSNSTAPLTARPTEPLRCNERDTEIWRVGYHSPDACQSNPSECLTAAHWRWDGLYTDQIQSVFDGDLNPDDNDWQPLLNSADSVVDLAPLNGAISAGARDTLDTLRANAVNDGQYPFIGPLNDNEGNEVIAANEDLTDAQLDQICWFVPGVIDTTVGPDADAVVPPSCAGQ